MSKRKAHCTYVRVHSKVVVNQGLTQSSLARIESSLGSRKHSPSLATLRRYAEACGKKLTIQIG